MGSIKQFLTSKSIATTQSALPYIPHVATLINSKVQSHTVHTQNDQKVIPAIHSSPAHWLQTTGCYAVSIKYTTWISGCKTSPTKQAWNTLVVYFCLLCCALHQVSPKQQRMCIWLPACVPAMNLISEVPIILGNYYTQLHVSWLESLWEWTAATLILILIPRGIRIPTSTQPCQMSTLLKQ